MRQVLRRASRVLALSCPAFALAVACSSFEEEPPTETPSGEAGTDTSSGSVDSSTPTDVSDAGPETVVTCPSARCQQIATDQANAAEIATDGVDVFWTVARPSDGAVRSVPLSGGAVRTVSAPVDSPKSLQLFGQVVFYATGSAAHQVAKDGTTVDAGAKLAASTGGSGPTITSVVRSGPTLFFTFANMLERCPAPGIACTPGIGTNTTIGGGARALALSPNGLPWLAHDNGIWSIDDVANASATIRFGGVLGVRALVVDETRVYFVRDASKDVSTIERGMPNGTAPSPLATAAGTPRAIAIDATDIYFTTLETGTITRVSKFGSGAAEVIVKGLQAPQGIAVTSDRIFVVEASQITSIPKPPKTP